MDQIAFVIDQIRQIGVLFIALLGLCVASFGAGLYVFTYSRQQKKAWTLLLLAALVFFVLAYLQYQVAYTNS